MKYAVNLSSDEQDLRAAMRHMRALVRIGRAAQSALQKIERGEANGTYLTLQKQWGRFTIERVSIYPSIEPERTMAPPFDDITLDYGDVLVGNHGIRSVPVIARGTGHLVVKGKVTKIPVESTIGRLRLLKKKPTLEILGRVHKIDPDNENFLGAVALSVTDAFLLTEVNGSKVRASMGSSYMHPASLSRKESAQLLKELSDLTPKWMIGEGHARRMIQEIAENLKIIEVMKA